MEYRIGFQYPTHTTNGCVMVHTNWPLLIEARTFAFRRQLTLTAEQEAAVGKSGLVLIRHLLGDRRVTLLEIGFKHLQVALFLPPDLTGLTGEKDGVLALIVRGLSENAGLFTRAFEIAGRYYLVDPAKPDEWNWCPTAFSFQHLYLNGIITP